MGALIGLFVYLQTKDIYDKAWIDACNESTNGNMEQWLTDHPGLVSFAEHFEFGAFKGLVCRQTQLFYQLNESNASAITGLLTASISMPLLMAILIEGGRGDAGAPLKLPVVMWVLSQEFGLAVVFPMLYLPLYAFYRGASKSAIHPFRVYASLPLVFPQLVLTILVFWFSPGSSSWNNCVGLLAGPIFAGCTMLLSLFGDPPTTDTEDVKKLGVLSRRIMALNYGAAGLVSLLIWLWLVFIMILPTFGLSGAFEGLQNELWSNATVKLRCKTVEVIALWIAGLIFVGTHNTQAVLEALGIGALFGPGAGLCLALAGVAVSEDMEEIAKAERLEQNKPKED